MVAAATTLTLALTSTHRVIDRIHCHTADMRTSTQPTTSSRRAARHVHMFNVSDLADRRVRVFMNASHLPGRHSHERITPFTVAQNCLLTRASGYLAAPARNDLNVVDDRSQRDRFQRQSISNFRSHIVARNNLRADSKSIRRQNVCLFPSGILNQSDACRRVRVVLNRCDSRFDISKLSLEIDDAILALVAAANVARG